MRQSPMLARRRGLMAVAVVAALATVLAACSSSSSGSKSAGTTTPAAAGSSSSSAGGAKCSNIPAGPIKIAIILPLSGPTASSGELLTSESSIDVDYFNANDSICGHSIQLTNYNDKGDPATSLSIARQLVSQHETIIMQDSYSSPQNQIQPYLMQQHVLVVTNNGAYAIVNPKDNPTFFSDGPSNAQYAQMMVNWAKSHNDNNIGILSDGTSFSVELAADAQADTKAAGLTFVKTITYSPTAIDLTTQLTEAKEAGIQTVFPTGFTGITQMVAGIKQIGWSPNVIGWGGLDDYGVTASQVPAGTVDGCDYHLTDGQPTSSLLTPENTALAQAAQAKLGLNPATPGVILTYVNLLVIKHAVETANSLDGLKLKAALESTTNLATNIPGLTETWSSTDHTGWPAAELVECQLKPGPFDILYAAS
jgi:branched-chain amino acid transport system substrate-binding protein